MNFKREIFGAFCGYDSWLVNFEVFHRSDQSEERLQDQKFTYQNLKNFTSMLRPIIVMLAIVMFRFKSSYWSPLLRNAKHEIFCINPKTYNFNVTVVSRSTLNWFALPISIYFSTSVTTWLISEQLFKREISFLSFNLSRFQLFLFFLLNIKLCFSIK